MVQFRMIMLDVLHMLPDAVHRWTERISEGWDEPIKGMLFALSPKLDRLNFIAYVISRITADSPSSLLTLCSHAVHDHRLHPLVFLCQAIRAVHDSLGIGGIWPAGFQSLRQISICNSPNLERPHDAYFIKPSGVAPLFLLPNIKILNLTLLGYHSDVDESTPLPPGCSSVEELAFSCCSMSLHAFANFIQACKRLRSYLSLSVYDLNIEEDLMHVLSRYHGTSLELLSLGRSDLSTRQQKWLGTVSTLFPDLKTLEHLKLQDLLLDQSGNITGVECPPGYLPLSGQQQAQRRSIQQQIVDLRETLPTGIENLHIDFIDRTGAAGDDIPNAVLSALADLVEDVRFDSITSVCLNSLKEADCDQDALRRIKARGIDTHSSGGCLHRDASQGLSENETDPRRDREPLR